MQAAVDSPGFLAQARARNAAIDAACARFAPTWPLDQAIAVNPWWGWRDLPIERVDAVLGKVSGASMRMPLAWYREQWSAGAFALEDLEAVSSDPQYARSLARILEGIGDAPAPRPMPLVTDIADQRRDLAHAMSWRAFVLQHVSQQCAACFDEHQAAWHPASDGLYASWRAFAVADRSAAALLGADEVSRLLTRLPPTADDAIAQALDRLGWSHEPASALQAYLTALLASVQGWAAWAAWIDWQAGLRHEQPPGGSVLRELLAIRLSWDAVLACVTPLPPDWHGQWHAVRAAQPDCTAQAIWKFQAALEHAYRAPLARKLCAAARAERTERSPVPDVLAFFCIDVRSEPMRRALEDIAGSRVCTGGFAGFFGLPVAHQPLGAHTARPQLPGLLAPQRTTRELVKGDRSLGEVLQRSRRKAAAWAGALQQLRSGPASGFSYVEALGGLAAARLLARTLVSDASRPADDGTRVELAAREGSSPEQELRERRDLAAGILRAMGLATPGLSWPAVVLLVGHGSISANNPFGATLQCGACGGQTGEVNARAFAALLNDPAVRALLPEAGIDIPAATHFVAAVHWTSTDDVQLYDLDPIPARIQPLLATVGEWLQAAGQRVRTQRAASLRVGSPGPGTALRNAFARRSKDWSEVRPEWGLANNAAFVVAPRERTRGIDLQGRCFLHDYDWHTDAGFSVLESIITAPMVVTHWISSQYMASVVDPHRWGSGNKTLHNVVGGRIGVFEGNGGDLRIGLPLQSVHDGAKFVHAPLRLSVFVEAPAQAIDDVIARHDVVRALVDNGWLHLHCIQPGGTAVLVRQAGRWNACA